jgi:transposase InsO family protein
MQSEDTKLTVPKLSSDGSNWVIYRNRLVYTLNAHGLDIHLTQDAPTQEYIDGGDIGGLTPEARWRKEEGNVKTVIGTSVPDDVFNRISEGGTAKGVWDALKQDYEDRSLMTTVELVRRFRTKKCGEKENVRTHFQELSDLRDQLAAIGKSVDDSDFTATLLASLPPSYVHACTAINSSARLGAVTLTPSIAKEIVLEEYQRRVAADPKNESHDEAFNADPQKKKKRDVECFNCHKRGHVKAECYAKGGGQEGQGPKRKGRAKEGTAAVAEPQTEAWAAFEEVCVDGDGQEYVAAAGSARANNGVETELYDSGASRHMSPFRDRFVSYKTIPPRAITAADKRVFYAIGVGDLKVEVPNGKSTTSVLLRDALHAPDMGLTIVSISRITSAGHSVSFEGQSCRIKNKTGALIGDIPASASGLYKVEHAYSAKESLEKVNLSTLHRRLGHIAPDTIRSLIRNHLIDGVDLIDDGSPLLCDSCEYAKFTRKPIRKERVSPLADAFGAEIHSDVWGPSPVSSLGGKKYYITFTDDYSRYTRIQLLRSKDEALAAYKAFAAWAQTQRAVHIQRLRSDRGGEFTGNEFTSFLQEQGTERRLTTHDTPQHNGVAESLNRRLVERVRAVLHHSGLPKTLWGEAIHHVVWLKNRSSTRVLGTVTPYERLHGQKPNLADVPEWGLPVWVHNDKGSKLDGRGTVGRWIGFDADSTHAHRIYWPQKGTVTVERNIRLTAPTVTVRIPALTNSAKPPAADAPAPPSPGSVASARSQGVVHSDQQPQVANDSGEEEVPDEELSDTTDTPVTPQPRKSAKKVRLLLGERPVRRSTRTIRPSLHARRIASGEGSADGSPREQASVTPPGGFRAWHPYRQEGAATAADMPALEGADDSDANDEDYAFHASAAAQQDAEGDPKSLSEARSRADWPDWKAAMDRELETLEKALTWTTVPQPKGKNIVGSKWVFKLKRKADGSIDKYKARLVAKGFTQIHGVDYFSTYSPVAKLSSFRAILAIAARNDWEIESFDFNGAYLNGELDDGEEIYMQPPPGYESGAAGTVKRLHKSLYGLKQAGRKWYDALCRVLTDLGFEVSQADPGVFHARVEGHILILAVHVDDCAMTGSSGELIAQYKQKFHSCYALTDLGPLHWLLGIKVTRDRAARTISLSQASYIDSIISRFSLSDARPYQIPMTPSVTLSKRDVPSNASEASHMSRVPYREAIGSLMYASVATRPDITFAVSTLSQFLENPGEIHWEACKRVFRYLAGTKDLALTYGGERHDLVGFTDADGASQEHRHAISGHVFLIDGGAISWSSRKQELVTLSTAEAEYVAATHAAKEAIWLRRLLAELFMMRMPTTLYCDNQAALKLAVDDNFHARTKHIDVRYHFIRMVVANGSIVIIYCPTDEMTADILTKALPSWKVRFHVQRLGLCHA